MEQQKALLLRKQRKKETSRMVERQHTHETGKWNIDYVKIMNQIHSEISNHATLIVEKPVGSVEPHQGTPDICGAANRMSQAGSKPQGNDQRKR